MERILITGASGQLGLALNQLMAGQDSFEILRTDAGRSEDGTVQAMDITEEAAVRQAVEAFRPDIIINCAAMTAVDLCESKQELAYKINALGPKYLALAAESCGAKLVHVSTDYVYDGQKDKPYVETDEPRPLSVYGRTKLEGEEFVRKHCSRSFILRTAWVYGVGKNFVKTMLRLSEAGNPIRVVNDQFGSPTSALELAKVVLFLMDTDSYGIYHTTCEGFTNWYEFAKTIFRLADKEVEVIPIPTSEYPTPAVRPNYSVLENQALKERHGYEMKHWTDAIEEYMQTLK